MKTVLCIAMLCLAVLRPAWADIEPTPGPGRALGASLAIAQREVCWSEPPGTAFEGGSSDIVRLFGLESKLANDFVVAERSRITRVRWWGFYYAYVSGDPIGFPVNLQFYGDAGGVPGDIIFEFPCVDGHDRQTGEEFGYLGFEYWADVQGPCMDPGPYWFVAQCCDHPFPPLWGRQAAVEVTGHSSMFWSPYFSYPDWVPTRDVWGLTWDGSQEFECEPCEPTAVQRASWGAIRALYR